MRCRPRFSSGPGPELLAEVNLRQSQLRPRLALARQLHQSRVVAPRGLGVARHLGGPRRTVEAAEAVGLAFLRQLVLLQRFGRTLELHQHVTELLARRQEAARGYRVLLV